jgi:hypothetical protein
MKGKDDEFQSVVSAYQNVRAAKKALEADNKSIGEEITKAQDELAWLQNSYLSLPDLKECIIQFLCRAGQDYQMKIPPAIKELATNGGWGVGFPIEEYGMPLKYRTIEKALDGELGSFVSYQIFTPDKSIYFDDRVFLGLLFKLIEPTIRSIMEEMQPEQFGYGRITANQIGPALEERKQMIQDIKAKIKVLEEKKAANAEKLITLSV